VLPRLAHDTCGLSQEWQIARAQKPDGSGELYEFEFTGFELMVPGQVLS